MLEDFADTIDLVLDGGAREAGIDWTVIDLPGGTVRVPRPGFTSLDSVRAALGAVEDGNAGLERF